MLQYKYPCAEVVTDIEGGLYGNVISGIRISAYPRPSVSKPKRKGKDEGSKQKKKRLITHYFTLHKGHKYRHFVSVQNTSLSLT